MLVMKFGHPLSTTCPERKQSDANLARLYRYRRAACQFVMAVFDNTQQMLRQGSRFEPLDTNSHNRRALCVRMGKMSVKIGIESHDDEIVSRCVLKYCRVKRRRHADVTDMLSLMPMFPQKLCRASRQALVKQNAHARYR